MAALVRMGAALWCGALWVVGLLVVPLLFMSLGVAQAAGIAGTLFDVLAYGGLAMAALLWLFDVLGRHQPLGPAGRRAVLLMAVGVGIGHFGLQPLLAYTRELSDAGGSAFWLRYSLWHGVSSAIYFLVALLGLRLVAVVR